jgi:hypothetical protein
METMAALIGKSFADAKGQRRTGKGSAQILAGSNSGYYNGYHQEMDGREISGKRDQNLE